MTEGVSNMMPNDLCKSGSVGVLLSSTQAKVSFTHGRVNKEYKLKFYATVDVSHKVIDTISGEELGANKEGEIVTSGPNVMLGYMNRPDDTAETLDQDGWLHTGLFIGFRLIVSNLPG